MVHSIGNMVEESDSAGCANRGRTGNPWDRGDSSGARRLRPRDPPAETVGYLARMRLGLIFPVLGRALELDRLRTLSETNRIGSNLYNLARAAESVGFRSLAVKVSLSQLLVDSPFP